jgi:GH25 family lysozyme M1 (1,4-beta-N-acetylmuramidase)
MTILRGCDVSTFQSPTLVNWSNYDFGIVRATYGSRKDGKTVAHAQKIREAGKTLGLYHFFLPKTDLDAQLKAYCEAADSVALGDNDILPCIDIETYPDQFSGNRAIHWAEVSPSWNEPLERFIGMVEKSFGGTIPYITQRDWHLLGKPDWVLKRPLWVAHYPKIGSKSPLNAPATPGSRPYAIWQLMVGPLGKTLQDPQHPAAVDQNITSGPLPLIKGTDPLVSEDTSTEEPIDMGAIPFIGLTDDDWEEMRAARDAQVRLL